MFRYKQETSPKNQLKTVKYKTSKKLKIVFNVIIHIR